MADQQDTRRLHRFARVLLEQPDPNACQRCLDSLEVYCVAQIAGAEAANQFPEVAFHLDTCVACAEVYALLYETLLSPEPLAQPTNYPTADLRFLPQIADQNRTALLLRDLPTTLAQAIRRSGRSLRLQLSQHLVDLLPPPASTTALAFRSPGETPPLFELHMVEPDALIEELLVNAITHADPEYCDLRVRVTLHGQSWPDLEGIEVQLRQGELQQRTMTDAWGEALFRRVERSRLSTVELAVEIP